MNKVYFIAPLLLLVVFSGFFAVHRSGLKAREAAQVAKVEAARQAKLDAEQAARKAAMADAIAAAEQRKKDKAAKEAQDKLDKEARQAAIDVRDKAYREQEKISRQLEKLKKDIEVEQVALAKLKASRQEAQAEKAFQEAFVTKAQANVQALQTLLVQLNTPPPAPVPAAK
jgi:membrane-associated HD superfamily phosphohydrolase